MRAITISSTALRFERVSARRVTRLRKAEEKKERLKTQRKRSRTDKKYLPLRNADGEYAAIIEFKPATTVMHYERFCKLARFLYKHWVLEPPPWEMIPPVNNNSLSSPISNRTTIHEERRHVG